MNWERMLNELTKHEADLSPVIYDVCVCPSRSPYVGISVVYKAEKEILERQSSLY